MISGFKQFILRGNVVDLAVGIVIGAAFASVVSAFVKDVLTPLIGSLGQVPDFAQLSFTVNGSKFLIGEFINALIAFLIMALVVYFLVVLPLNKLVNRMKRNKIPEDPTTKKCPECLSDVPKDAKRCAFCTSPLVAENA